MEVKKYRMARSWLTDPDSGNSAGQWKNFVQQRKQEWKTREGFKGAGLVEHGPEGVRQGFAGLTEAEKDVNVKAWEKNTGKDFKKTSKKMSRSWISMVKAGEILGAVPGEGGYSYTGPEGDKAATKHYGKILKGQKWSEMSLPEKRVAQKAKYGDWRRFYVPAEKTPLQIEAKKQLEWVSKSAEKYSNPKLFEKNFMTHFKIKNLADAAIFENAMSGSGNSRSINVGNISNIEGSIIGDTTAVGFTKNSSESNLFKSAVMQNNKKAVKELKESFEFIHDNFGDIRKKIRSDQISFEAAVELLDKRNKVLKNWDLTFPASGKRGGVGQGLFRDDLIKAGISEEQIAAFRLVRQPLIIVDDIIQSLSFPGSAKEWGLNKAQVAKTQKHWETIKQGQVHAGKWIDNLESTIGEGKFRKLFGKVIFEHQLAKQFGKNWNFLPRDYLLRGQVGSQSFNQMKNYTFDKPMIAKVNAYKKAAAAKDTAEMLKLEGEINNLHRAFNDVTEGYMKGYEPDFKGGKFEWKATEPAPFSKQMIHKYDNPRLAIKETQEMSLGMRNLSKAAAQVGEEGEQIFSKKQLGHIKDFRKKQDKFANLLGKNLDSLDTNTLKLLGKRHGCLDFQGGGSLMNCLKGKLNQSPEKFLQTTGKLAVATKSSGLLKWIKAGRTVLRGTGLFAMWEAVFAPVIAGMMIPAGESGKRITHDIFYGPLLEAMGVPPEYVPGEGEEEELMRHFKNDPKAYAAHKLMEIGGEGTGEEKIPGELDYLYEDWSAVAGKGTPTSKAKGELWKSPQLLQIEKLIKDKEQEYQKYLNTPDFYQGPAGQYKDQEAIDKAFETRDEGLLKLAADREANKEWYREHKLLAEEGESWDIGRFRKAGGGMTGIRRPDAVPPKSGPDPQGEGLSYLLNRVRKE